MMEQAVATYKPSPLSRLLIERRQRAKLSQEELAEATHVARSAIANIESGKTRSPSVELINAIADVLPVTVREMVRAIGYAIEDDVEFERRLLATEDEVNDALRDAFRRLFGRGPIPPAEPE